jgi:phosphoribosylcarboxyaminoimidazole (NCAIR) mutase
MISGTYILSGALLAVTAYLFDKGTLTATTQAIAWVIIFFFASAGASAAYLTAAAASMRSCPQLRVPVRIRRLLNRPSTPAGPASPGKPAFLGVAVMALAGRDRCPRSAI